MGIGAAGVKSRYRRARYSIRFVGCRLGCVSSVSGGIFRAEVGVVFFFSPFRDTPKGDADGSRRLPLRGVGPRGSIGPIGKEIYN